MSENSGGDRRPSPDALLKEAQKGTRGRLKIFLGAAPGVGKTFEMLSSAQVRRREGVDVVIGIVETHGRAETQALVAGLPVMPRVTVTYRGTALTEMDLDGILARRPALVLVDELAHTNAPGSRHPKRHMDVEELLEAGIDVYTTLNIQHVESLNDVVARITRIRVRETVPDSVIDAADDIELIDLTPEDLIQRLKEGKVYVPAQAERAVRHYFAAGNLTALRELALRRTAQRVDNQMVDYMRSHAIEGPWPAGERVLVCIQGGKRPVATVRHAKRLADTVHAPWTALFVETAGSQRAGEKVKAEIVEALRLAQQLGGDVVQIPGADVADAVIEYARTNNVTHVIVGKSVRPRWQQVLFGSVVQRLINRAGGINVHVIETPADGKDNVASAPGPPMALAPKPYLVSVALVLAAIPVANLLREVLGFGNIALVFLTAILAGAVMHGLGPSLFASLVAVLAYNFFFLPPLYTFTIADPENVVALFFFAIVAFVASNLAGRVRSQAVAAGQRARATDDLYQFSRKLAVAVTLDDLLWATAHQIALMLKVRVVLLLPEGITEGGVEGGGTRDGVLTVRAGFPPEDILDDADFAAARWSWEKNHEAGRGSDTLPGAKWLFQPMRTGRGPVGVVGIIRDEPGVLLRPDQERLMAALTDQAALAIERVNLARDLHRARLEAETDRLRSALLTSISHDLRTPLASILGSATSLRSQGAMLDKPTQDSLLGTIIDEADRLNRFIGNLLDMTRLESGALKPNATLAELSDVVGAVLQRASRILAGHDVQVALAPDLPLLSLDMVLFEQVLFNLLDNAAKHAPAGSVIRIAAERVEERAAERVEERAAERVKERAAERVDGRAAERAVQRADERVTVRISDEGPGIPAGEAERIFEKFYRGGGPDRRRAGTGLGLAICRGFVEAMGGTISAANRSDRPGAVFTITLPVPAVMPMAAEEAAE
ncbi:MAG TPA: sensor histidine kinase KdpD [Rhodopila sp.]|uniref:sensor histidine kinase KdpD n=1 Tax=Rhodopila sp. TaxID=2480087 RepID=UPI002B540B95|nr:sensor histidine kinase KdpD [Rhodopila sp.]HVY17711.1 sensor histidine kinase KdpD [Rhodopila sp.]